MELKDLLWMIIGTVLIKQIENSLKNPNQFKKDSLSLIVGTLFASYHVSIVISLYLLVLVAYLFYLGGAELRLFALLGMTLIVCGYLITITRKSYYEVSEFKKTYKP